MNNRTPKLYHGIIAFLIALIYLMFGSPIVSYFMTSLGMPLVGIIITQIVVAAIALVFALIIKVDFKETFPLKLPPVHQFFGAVFTYVAIYLVTISLTFIMTLLFPAMQDTIKGLTTLTTIMPHPAIAIIVIAVLPAICEELLMRGFVLHSFSNYKSILAIIIVGVMFGILHFDVYRFVPTAILGMASAYIVIKTKSLILPMLYHFVNNTMSVIAMYQINDTTLENIASELESLSVYTYIGAILIYCAIALTLGYVGISLLNKIREKQKVTLIIVLISIALFITGIILMISNIDISEYYSQINMPW